MHLVELENMNSVPKRLNVPRVYNLIKDPKEEYNMASEATWVLPVMFKKVVSFQQTLVEEPPIPPGTPDPYEPPKKSARRGTLARRLSPPPSRSLDSASHRFRLTMATANVGELLKLSALRNPYPGELGVVKEGALADLLLVEGNPLEDLTAVNNQDNLKDGKIYKNEL